ncbi:hypothetical protein FOBRF1_011685 [Fusarium oxysporum]
MLCTSCPVRFNVGHGHPLPAVTTQFKLSIIHRALSFAISSRVQATESAEFTHIFPAYTNFKSQSMPCAFAIPSTCQTVIQDTVLPCAYTM